MIYQVYWRGQDRIGYNGYVKAESREEAYDITKRSLQAGTEITAVYESDAGLTAQSLCLNFKAPENRLYG